MVVFSTAMMGGHDWEKSQETMAMVVLWERRLRIVREDSRRERSRGKTLGERDREGRLSEIEIETKGRTRENQRIEKEDSGRERSIGKALGERDR